MTPCEHGDGYLGKWLSDGERIAFEAHFDSCPACRRYIAEQRRLDALLARATEAAVSVPAGLLDQIDRRLRRARRRRMVAWSAGLAAAGIGMAIVSTALLPQHAPDMELTPSSSIAKPEPVPAPHAQVTVTVPPSSDVIAVPQKSDNPSVTIIWLYPTLNTAKETGPAPANSF
ncbi:MAG TPA: zf-HC2 domain-containing protein [Gemmataceae bacterium]|nr:zf-HC2 domain-containing protein [Gemmataceae bacterium]